jgi:hypothetical protein
MLRLNPEMAAICWTADNGGDKPAYETLTPFSVSKADFIASEPSIRQIGGR